MQYDVLVIGGGTAGCAAARAARQRGLSVALADMTRLGGECIWWTCLPTKSLLESAQVYHMAKHAGQYGTQLDTPSLDYARVLARKDALVARFAQQENAETLAHEGIEVFHGRASFLSPSEVQVHENRLSAKDIVLAVGAQPLLPPIPGFETIKPLTYMRAMSLKAVPPSLAIVGGGVVGCEFAQLYRRLGAEVTLIEMAPRLLLNHDGECAAAAARLLAEEGVNLILDAAVEMAERDGEQKALVVRHAGETRRIVAAEVLAAVGRLPRLDELQPEAAGLTMERRRLLLRETLQTNVPHIWACGDASGGPQFRPLAESQGRHVGRNVGSAVPEPFTPAAFPCATFTDPELAGVGMTEEQARQEGRAVVIGRASFNQCGRAVILGKSEGFVKLLADPHGGRILGGHIVGPHAGELIQTVTLAVAAGSSVHLLAQLPCVYPSLVEPLHLAAADAATRCA